MRHLTAPQLAEQLADDTAAKPLLLDVREPWEFALCHLKDSVNLPLGSVASRLDELNPETPTICICHHGARSAQVAAFLEQQGFAEISNLTGGVHAWAQQVDATMTLY